MVRWEVILDYTGRTDGNTKVFIRTRRVMWMWQKQKKGENMEYGIWEWKGNRLPPRVSEGCDLVDTLILE